MFSLPRWMQPGERQRAAVPGERQRAAVPGERQRAAEPGERQRADLPGEATPVTLGWWLERLRVRAGKQDGARAARRQCGRFIGRARRAERIARASAGLTHLVAVAFGALAVVLAADLVAGPGAGTRTALAVGLAATTGLAAGAILLHALLRGASDRWLAQRIEERWPALDGRLLVLATQRQKDSPAVDAVAPGVAQVLARLRPSAVPDRRPVRDGLVAALAASALLGAVVAAYAGLAPERLGRAVALESEPAEPGSVRLLAVRPGAARVVEGQGLAVTVGAEGEPRDAFVLVRPRGAGEHEAQRVALERQACGRFSAALPAFVEDASYRVVLDGASSAEFPVTLVRAPRVVAVQHHEDYPAYLLEKARDVPGGDVDAIEGTRVLVRATTASDPLRGRLRATWTEDGLVETIPLVATGARTLEGSFIARRNGNYRIDYEDATGLPPRPSVAFTVAVRPDLPPRVEVVSPACDKEIAYGGSLEVEYEGRDDHGLGELALHVVIHGGKPHKLPLPLGSDPTCVHGKVVLSPRQLGLLPGDSALYYLVAEDKKTPLANRARSAPFVLAVEEDAKLREELTGIDSRDEELFRTVESDAGTKEGDDDVARNQEALRRLERILAREPDAGSGEDMLKELTPEDVEDVARALEDLDQDQDSVLLPENAACPDCDKIAKGSGVCPKCGRVNRCGSCGKPGHGRGCMAPQGMQTARGAAGDGSQRGQPGAGKGTRGEQSREAIEGARRSFITRVGTSRELTKIYRELLERRRDLLRRLADDMQNGKLPGDAIARLGPEGARILEALRSAASRGVDPGLGAMARKPRGRGIAPAPRTLKVRADIPQDAVDLRARREVSSGGPAGAAAASRAPAWDEALPDEMKAVVRAYFKRSGS